MKKISLILIVLIISVVYFNENLINTFAENYSKQYLVEGELYKSGDVINILNAPGCEGVIGYESAGECKFTFRVTYVKYKEGYHYEENSLNNIEKKFTNYENGNDIDHIDTFTFDQYEGKDAYWKVVKVNNSSYYGLLDIFVEYVDYVNPTLEIKCENEEIDIGATTNCELNLKHNYDVKEIEFDLNNEFFEISNFKANEFVEDSSTNNHYVLVNKSIVDEEKKDLTTTKLATFTLTANSVDNSTDFKDNIKVVNIKYQDTITNSNIENISTTLNIIKKEEPKKEETVETIIETKEEVENPPTGYKNVICGILFFLFVGIGLIKLAKKYKVFQKL